MRHVNTSIIKIDQFIIILIHYQAITNRQLRGSPRSSEEVKELATVREILYTNPLNLEQEPVPHLDRDIMGSGKKEAKFSRLGRSCHKNHAHVVGLAIPALSVTCHCEQINTSTRNNGSRSREANNGLRRAGSSKSRALLNIPKLTTGYEQSCIQ